MGIVPHGLMWQCDKACEACFRVMLAETKTGEITAKLGSGSAESADAQDAANETPAKEIGDADSVGPDMSEDYIAYGCDGSNTTALKLSIGHWSDFSHSIALAIGDEALCMPSSDNSTNASLSLRGSWHPYHQYRRRACKYQCRWGGW